MLRFAAIAAILLGLAGTARAEEAGGTGRLTGAAGSYVMLFDAGGNTLGAWYWIAPNVILVFPGNMAAGLMPGPNQVIVADRGLLPTRIVSTYTLVLRGIDYEGPVPPSGQRAEIGATSYVMGMLPGIPPHDHTSYRIGWEWTGDETRAVPAGAVAARRYRADHLTLTDKSMVDFAEGPETRVYLPAYDVDISEATWEATADLVAGTGLMASADLGFLLWGRMAPNEGARECLAALRQAPAYQDYLTEFARLEQRTVALLPLGSTDVMTFGIADYSALEERTKVYDSFMQCLDL